MSRTGSLVSLGLRVGEGKAGLWQEFSQRCVFIRRVL